MIVDHPTLRFSTRFDDEPCKIVECDNCGCRAKRVGNTIGDAADEARKDGFTTVRGATLSDPRKWACRKCRPG